MTCWAGDERHCCWAVCVTTFERWKNSLLEANKMCFARPTYNQANDNTYLLYTWPLHNYQLQPCQYTDSK